MNVSQDDARASLSTIRDARIQTQRAAISTYASPMMILWGTLWIIAFIATHLYIEHGQHIFTAMNVVGIAVSAIIFYQLFLLAPFSGMQCNAFISTAGMFACVVMGLWFKSTFMIVLGLVMTGVTLVGFYLLTSCYCLWMAMMGGGSLLGAGLYIRVRWR